MARTRARFALLTGAVLTGALTAAAPAAAEPGDTVKTPADSIVVLGRPMIVSATTTSVTIRYRCTTELLGQIGVRVDGSVVHSNRWARFGYPFTAAECDGRRHVTTIEVSAYPPADVTTTMTPGERVTVSVDLLEYGPPTSNGPGPVTVLAGHRKTGVRIR